MMLQFLECLIFKKNHTKGFGSGGKEQEFVLHIWIYYDLQTKIKYKTEKAGIELIIG